MRTPTGNQKPHHEGRESQHMQHRKQLQRNQCNAVGGGGGWVHVQRFSDKTQRNG